MHRFSECFVGPFSTLSETVGPRGWVRGILGAPGTAIVVVMTVVWLWCPLPTPPHSRRPPPPHHLQTTWLLFDMCDTDFCMQADTSWENRRQGPLGPDFNGVLRFSYIFGGWGAGEGGVAGAGGGRGGGWGGGRGEGGSGGASVSGGCHPKTASNRLEMCLHRGTHHHAACEVPATVPHRHCHIVVMITKYKPE
jgi:hypothetical protein